MKKAPIIAAVVLLSGGFARGQDSLEPVRALVQDGEYLDAVRVARELQPAIEKNQGAESVVMADLLDLLSEALRRGHRSSDPEPRLLAEKALKIKEKLLGPDDPSVAVSLQNLASALYVA